MGQRILADWENELKNFVKVMPRDFKRVLQAIAEAETHRRRTSTTAIMAAANG